MRLLTIPLSHFCEKARWALDLAQAPYEERGHAPGIHRLFLARHGATTAPVLIDGTTKLTDSTAIVEHADSLGRLGLFPDRPAERKAVDAFLKTFDERLGPDARLWFYTHAMEDDAMFVRLVGAGTRPAERRLLPALVPGIKKLVKAHFSITHRTRDEARERLNDVMDFAASARAGSPYLVNDTFTAADLAFAALSAPLVAPAQYGADLPPDEEFTEELRDEVHHWRATRSGKTTLQLYERHRQ
jgi:glutathione S-transferase